MHFEDLAVVDYLFTDHPFTDHSSGGDLEESHTLLGVTFHLHSLSFLESVGMVDIETVRRIALSLPESEDRSTATALRFFVRDKQFAWTYRQRSHPKRPRQPRLDVLAVRCAADDKERLLASDPGKFFTDDHYRGFPAMLVYLDCVDEQEIRLLLTSAWECQAPAHYDGSKRSTIRTDI